MQAILHTGLADFRQFVNPLVAQRVDLSGEPYRFAGTAEGQLVGVDGSRIEDLHGTQAFGHRNSAIAAAVAAFLASDAPNWFPGRVNPFAGTLARQLCERSGYSSAYFANSGSEAVEAAIKLARAATGRPRIVALGNAYHGCTMGSCALMAPGVYRDPFAPHLADVALIDRNDIDALERVLADRQTAAVVVEPIQLEGGVQPLGADFIAALCEATARAGTLLVADEVQTGMGRTGRFLASETWPRRPDVVTLGKHLGGGLVPISAMLTQRAWFQAAYGRNFETSEAHNCTFSGSAIACVAALAALELLDADLMAHVASVGAQFRRDLAGALAGSPLFDQVRGDGLAIGVALHATDHPWLSFDHFGMIDLQGRATIGLLLCQRLYKRGFFAFVCGHDWRVLRMQPRFAIEAPQLAGLARVIAEELAILEHLA